jgi:hypothetical protein
MFLAVPLLCTTASAYTDQFYAHNMVFAVETNYVLLVEVEDHSHPSRCRLLHAWLSLADCSIRCLVLILEIPADLDEGLDDIRPRIIKYSHHSTWLSLVLKINGSDRLIQSLNLNNSNRASRRKL